VKKFQAFQNDTQSIEVSGITFENGKDSINMYGDVNFTPSMSAKEIDDLIEILNEIKNSLNTTKEK
jgi:hypothetical protein